MTEEKKVIKRRPRRRFKPKNKEQASHKKKHWKKKRPQKNLSQRLRDLQNHFNKNYHEE
jgi:hypothetical protein